MKTAIGTIFIKTAMILAMLMIAGASFFSMAAMSHGSGTYEDCAHAVSHSGGCEMPPQAESCLDFHFGLLENLSHGLTEKTATQSLGLLLASALIFFTSGSLFRLLYITYATLKSKLRQFFERSESLVLEQMSNWFRLLEMRDPAHAFAMV